MNALRLLIMILAVLTVISLVTPDTFAETRTLTTTIIVKVMSETPKAPGEPPHVNEALRNAMPESRNERFVKLDAAAVTRSGVACYTMMEKL